VILEEVWGQIQEEYFRKSNPSKYAADLQKAKRIQNIRNEINGVLAGLHLRKLGLDDEGVLEYFGYPDDNEKAIRKLLINKTKLSLLIARSKNDYTNEDIDFWGLVASAENSLGRQINIDDNFTVSRWISLINNIKKQNNVRQNTKK
jgi:hypothetical protein